MSPFFLLASFNNVLKEKNGHKNGNSSYCDSSSEKLQMTFKCRNYYICLKLKKYCLGVKTAYSAQTIFTINIKVKGWNVNLVWTLN